jgi:hypothetical protein
VRGPSAAPDVQQESTATGRDERTCGCTRWDGDLRVRTWADGVPVVCKQGVASSSLASSTHCPRSDGVSGLARGGPGACTAAKYRSRGADLRGRAGAGGSTVTYPADRRLPSGGAGALYCSSSGDLNGDFGVSPCRHPVRGVARRLAGQRPAPGPASWAASLCLIRAPGSQMPAELAVRRRVLENERAVGASRSDAALAGGGVTRLRLGLAGPRCEVVS